MRFKSALAFLAPLYLFSSLCQANQSTGQDRSTLRIEQGKNQTIVLTVTNREAKPMFFLRPDHPWHWYGWELKITSPKGEIGFIPAPSPWTAGPESFILLNPGESFQTPIGLSHAHDLKDRTSGLFSTKGTYRAHIAYTFDAEPELKHHGQVARVISLLTSNNFRPRDYGFMPKSSSNVVELIVK